MKLHLKLDFPSTEINLALGPGSVLTQKIS